MKKFILSLFCILCFFCTTLQAEEGENLEIGEVLDGCRFVNAQLGGGYLGGEIYYNEDDDRTVVYSGDSNKKKICRDKESVTIFVGKYRGKEEKKEYQSQYPEMELDFFFDPIRALGYTTQEIQSHGYQMDVTIQEQIALFTTALSYADVLDDEMYEITRVRIFFDEACRPKTVDFALTSSVADRNRIIYEEGLLVQNFTYIDRNLFQDKWDIMQEELKSIVPMKDVKVSDYIQELSNVQRVKGDLFLENLNQQCRLLKKQGWDNGGVFAYLEAVDRKFQRFVSGYEGTQITEEEYVEQLERIYQTSQLVGSDVHYYMFKHSNLKPKNKALFVIDQMGGVIDKNGMLQLKNGCEFDPGVEPHSEFFEAYAQCVQNAYKKSKQLYKQLDDQKIHQFRMYIDKHNIDYIRWNFDGDSDYEKLMNYAKEYDISLRYDEPSRHHNKILREGTFSKQRYDKVMTPNGLSEFIVDVKTGQFITQWDVLRVGENGVLSKKSTYQNDKKSDQEKIVNTESFNYSSAKYKDAHDKLDVKPATPSKNGKKYLENDVKKMWKSAWKSPEKKEYKERYRKAKDYSK